MKTIAEKIAALAALPTGGLERGIALGLIVLGVALLLRNIGLWIGSGVIVPAMYRSDGTRQYVCKRYPSVLDLALRGFAPRPLRRLFRKRLDRYEMRDVIADAVVTPVPVMSGSFMMLRRKAIESTGGFDPEYFLYFEDFDWSVRLNRVTRSAYVPTVHAVHHGGGASRKGCRHIAYFTRSGWRFFNKHGWKWT